MNAATGKKSPSLGMTKLERAVNAQEPVMLQKPQVWEKRWYLTAHQLAPPCSTQVQKTFMCCLAHRTGSSSSFNPFFSSLHFFAASLYQHWPNSPASGLSLMWHFKVAGQRWDFGAVLLFCPWVPLHQET